MRDELRPLPDTRLDRDKAREKDDMRDQMQKDELSILKVFGIKDEYFNNEPERKVKVSPEPVLGKCRKCKEWTFIGGNQESCCGDEYVHID